MARKKLTSLQLAKVDQLRTAGFRRLLAGMTSRSYQAKLKHKHEDVLTRQRIKV